MLSFCKTSTATPCPVDSGAHASSSWHARSPIRLLAYFSPAVSRQPAATYSDRGIKCARTFVLYSGDHSPESGCSLPLTAYLESGNIFGRAGTI